MDPNQSSGEGETQTGTSSADQGGTQSGQQTGTEQSISREEYDKVARANNWAQSKVKELSSQLENLQSELLQLKQSDGSKGGKSNKDADQQLQNALAEIDTLKKDREALSAKLRDATVKSSVAAKAQEHLADGAFDVFWRAEGANFEAKEGEDGQTKIVHKSRPWDSLDEYFKTLPDFMRKSTRAKGTGGAKPNENATNGGKGYTKAQLQQMDEQERIKLLAQDPELRRRYATGDLG